MNHPQPVDTLRMPMSTVHALVDVLDRPGASFAGNNRRRLTRYSYTRPLVLSIYPPGQQRPPVTDARNFITYGRNLSAGGASVLHGAFVHPETPCELQLMDLDKQAHPAAARVVMCRFLTKRIHELRLRFDEQIEIARYIRNAEQQQPGTKAPARKPAPQPSANVGRALVISAFTPQGRAAEAALTALGMSVAHAATSREAYAATKDPVCVIVVADEPGTTPLLDLVSGLRRRGCNAAVLVHNSVPAAARLGDELFGVRVIDQLNDGPALVGAALGSLAAA